MLVNLYDNMSKRHYEEPEILVMAICEEDGLLTTGSGAGGDMNVIYDEEDLEEDSGSARNSGGSSARKYSLYN